MKSTVKRARKCLRRRKTQAVLLLATTPTQAANTSRLETFKPVSTPNSETVKLSDGQVLTVDTIRECKRQLESAAMPKPEYRTYIPAYDSIPTGGIYSQLNPVPVEWNPGVAPKIAPRTGTPLDSADTGWPTDAGLYAPTHSQASYLTSAIPRDKREKTVERCLKLLTESDVQFDTIAVRGVSGLLLGPLLAHLMHKELTIIRKPHREERTASGNEFEGHIACKNYIIVDDLIQTSSTCVQIYRSMSKISPGAKFVGLLLYAYSPEFRCKDDYILERIRDHAKDSKFECLR